VVVMMAVMVMMSAHGGRRSADAHPKDCRPDPDNQ